MKQVNNPAQSIRGTRSPSESASQLSRATQGLREMLLRGELRAGERIAEIPLSKKLGVSRTPLRLAFERLAYEGLIKALPHSGFAAIEFSMDDIWEAIETRGVLEGAAARLAAERLKSPAQVEHLRKINGAVDEILRLDDDLFSERYLDLNKSFHSAILDLANNQTLRRAAEQVYSLPFASPGTVILLYKDVVAAKDLIPIAQYQHRSLIHAIEHREGARAESLAREHSRLPRRNLELAMADRNILKAIPGGTLVNFRNKEAT